MKKSLVSAVFCGFSFAAHAQLADDIGASMERAFETGIGEVRTLFSDLKGRIDQAQAAERRNSIEMEALTKYVCILRKNVKKAWWVLWTVPDWQDGTGYGWDKDRPDPSQMEGWQIHHHMDGPGNGPNSKYVCTKDGAPQFEGRIECVKDDDFPVNTPFFKNKAYVCKYYKPQ